jgi:hypothetical protein
MPNKSAMHLSPRCGARTRSASHADPQRCRMAGAGCMAGRPHGLRRGIKTPLYTGSTQQKPFASGRRFQSFCARLEPWRFTEGLT